VRLKVFDDKILCERMPEADVTTGGIIIPECAKEKSIVVKVLDVGTGRILSSGKVVPPQVVSGDLIIVGKYCGSEFEHNLKTYFICTQADVQAAVLRED